MTRRWIGDLPAGTAFRFTGDRKTAKRALRGRILRHRPDAVLVCVSRTWREGNDRRGGRREDLTWWCRSVYVEPVADEAPGRTAGSSRDRADCPPERFMPRQSARRFT